MILLAVGVWSVCILMNTHGSHMETTRELHSPLGRELAKYKVDIAVLSQTQLADTGQVTAVGAGYKVFWSGRG